jgi:hypothetical protein
VRVHEHSSAVVVLLLVEFDLLLQMEPISKKEGGAIGSDEKQKDQSVRPKSTSQHRCVRFKEDEKDTKNIDRELKALENFNQKFVTYNAEKKDLRFYYTERPNLYPNCEPEEKHLLTYNLNPGYSEDYILDSAFSLLTITPGQDVHFQMSFESVDEYALICEEQGVSYKKKFEYLDQYEAIQICKDADENYEMFARQELMNFEKRTFHDFHCECRKCVRSKARMEAMEQWEAHNPPCNKFCCVITKEDLIVKRYQLLQREREERLQKKRSQRKKRQRVKKTKKSKKDQKE